MVHPAQAGYQDINWDFLRDKLVPLHPERCRLAYVLCRSLNTQRVVEFGTSFCVSTIYLAAAIRDNARAGTRGVVIGTEIEPTKAAAARPSRRGPDWPITWMSVKAMRSRH